MFIIIVFCPIGCSAWIIGVIGVCQLQVIHLLLREVEVKVQVGPSYSQAFVTFFRARFTLFHTSLLILFFCLSYFILAILMRECLGKHSCMSQSFLIAMLNGTSSIDLSLFGARKINIPNGHIIFIAPEVTVQTNQ